MLARVSLIVTILLVLLSSACNYSKPEYYEEQRVVSPLIQKSSPFAKFYEAERGKMPQKIYWIKDTSLPEDNPAITSIDSSTVRLKRIPPDTKDDFIVAHELCTFILSYEGFPTTFPTSKAKTEGVADVSSYLHTMLDTPLRDAILVSYGFNAETAYYFYLGDSLKVNTPIGDLAMKTKRLFFYVQMILYWQDVLKKSEISEFQQKWSSWYPEIAHDGSILLAKVRQIGYDTPEKMDLLYEDIIKTWGLNEYIGILTE